jgi:hypothetical protein
MSALRGHTRKRPASGKPPRRPRDHDIPPVPAVRSGPDPAPVPAATPEETEAEDRVRRMVEAAYT